MHNRGGKRAGAGRDPVPDSERRRNTTIKLHPRYRAWLRAQGRSQGELIEAALDATYDISGTHTDS